MVPQGGASFLEMSETAQTLSIFVSFFFRKAVLLLKTA